MIKRFLQSDPGGIRTLDPMIKSHLLYQLSYGVIFRAAKVIVFFKRETVLQMQFE